MASSYSNIIGFLITTLLYYYYLKPTLTLDILNNTDEKNKYTKDSYMYLAIYFLLVLLVQFALNTMIISNTCGGNLPDNIGTAGIFTFLPWTFIFGVLVVILTVYPGFKTAFSDVVGYYWVSGEANKVLTELLIDPNIQSKIDGATGTDSLVTKDDMQSAADAIIKICGNTSILINQIFPSNFESYWEILKPLMKSKYQTPDSSSEIKNNLFSLVVSKLCYCLYNTIRADIHCCYNNPIT